jgi:sterol desaturase/sphingolipid hydroxylase (fatty acid hydroxylase superfamily)
MLGEAGQKLLSIYQMFFFNPQTLMVIGFASMAILVLGLSGLEKRALSREALANTLTTLAIFAANLALGPLVYLLVREMQAGYNALGIASVDPAFWQGVPWVITAVIALIGKDFCDYWSHRALHAPLLWPVHAVHHSDSHVNGFTSFRVHVLELLTMKAFYITLLSWLGIPPELAATAYIVAGLHNAYVHFELDIDHGRLNWLIASPRFHRWHHADLPEAYGKNLANMIPAWDILFGTYREAGPCHEPMGLAKDGIPATDPAKLMLLPFVMWGRSLASTISGLFSRARGTPESRERL